MPAGTFFRKVFLGLNAQRPPLNSCHLSMSHMRSFPLKIPLISLIIWPFALEASAATYYVSSSGNDANSGLDAASPWQTVAKVNSTIFAPGSQILFERGDQWRESLMASSSGTAEQPITFDA